MIIKFNDDVQKVLLNSKKEMLHFKHPYIGTEHLVLSILNCDNFYLSKELNRLGCSYKRFYDAVFNTMGFGTYSNKRFIYTPLLKRIINITMDNSSDNFRDITLDDLFFSLVDEGEGVAIRIFLSMNISIDDLYAISNRDHLVKGGKKKLLNEFSNDLNTRALNKEIDPVVGREKEINRVIEILLRRCKNNPLLLGEAGVGKTAIVEEFARLLATNNVPSKLKGCKVLSISMASLVAGTKYRGEFEERVTKLLLEAEDDPSIILFIDEIHTLVGAGGAEGAIDASNILKPSLARGKIKVIGATTIDEYKKCIADDKALERRFQIVKVDEPINEIVFKILSTLKPLYEKHHGVLISDDILDSIVKLSNRYIYDRKQPDKSIDILDEVCSRVANIRDKNSIVLDQLMEQKNGLLLQKKKYIMNQEFDKAVFLSRKEKALIKSIKKFNNYSNNIIKKVSINDVNFVISSISSIPIVNFEDSLIDTLSRMRKYLSSKIYCQDEVIDKLVYATQSMKLGINNGGLPYSFLFAGPTGVGKTFLAKEYAKFLGYNLIKIDMSEFKEEFSISKILGAPSGYKGYDDHANILEEIKNKPYSVVLLDEVEKAHPSVLNLFLQVLDDGRLKDSRGSVIRFDNCIVIMTSNLGFKSKSIGFNEKDNDYISEVAREVLSPELVNRINNIITFNSLDQKSVVKLIKIVFNDKKQILDKYGIAFNFTKKRIDELITKCDFNNFGARHINMAVSELINKLVMSTFDDKVLNKLS